MREILQVQRTIINDMQKQHKRIIPFVFPKANGRTLCDSYRDKEGIRPLKPSGYFKDRWKAACEAAKTSRTTHDLRRTAAVNRITLVFRAPIICFLVAVLTCYVGSLLTKKKRRY